MKVLVIDSNCLGHIAKHSMKGLSFDEIETGVIFGFMNHVLRLAKKFETNRFAFCWDSRKSLRKEVYPKYKYKRHDNTGKTEEEIVLNESAYRQFVELRKKVLPEFGFKNVFIQKGIEADDLIASIVRANKNEYIVVSHDEDLYQLLNLAPIYNPRKKILIDADYFKKQYGIDPDDWSKVKAIAGCGSDSVGGIENVGEKTAIKYLTGTLKKGKAYDSIREGNDVILRNKKLVYLPFSETEEVKISFKKEEFDVDDFFDMCDNYGFYSFKRETDNWKKTFRMK